MKKVVALILAIMLVCVSSVVLAAGSKTTNNVNNVVTEEKKELIIEIVDPSEVVAALFEKMAAGEALPEGAGDAELTEAVQVVAYNVEDGIGTVSVTLTTTTVFEADKTVLVFLGVANDEGATWEEVTPVAVDEEGALEMSFTEDQLKTMQDVPNVVLAIFVAA